MATRQEEAVELPRVYLIEKISVDGGKSTLKPAARGGATLTQIEETGVVYLIGGANREGTSFGDIHRFDLDTRRWTLIKPSSGSFPPRSGHSAVAIGAKIYVFGGLDAASSGIYNDVHIFDTQTSSWTKAAIKGETPLPRNAHAAIALPQTDDSMGSRKMLVYGGSSPEYGAFNDLYLLHIPAGDNQPLRWEKCTPEGEIPEARELHCALLQSETTVCFAGGRNFDGKVCTDMALLDFSNWTWQLMPICEWNRCSLAAGAVDGELIAFGGWDGGRICGDCCRYSDDEESWIPVITADSKEEKQPAEPSPSEIPERFGHCGTTVEIQTPSKPAEKSRRQGFLIFGALFAILQSSPTSSNRFSTFFSNCHAVLDCCSWYSYAVHGFLECRQPNYLAKGGKILAVDSDDASVQTEIRIKGVSWGGIEKIDMIPDGLWDTESPNSKGTQATTISKLQDFLDSNGFNSIRLSLNADYVNANRDPQLSYIHGYENPELTTWDDPEHVDYVNLLARVVETLQNRKLTVLLDIHRLTKYEQDAFWYTNPFVKVTESGTYKAATYLAEKLCGSRFWNIIGIDLKDEMLRAQWNADPEDSDETTDWHQAAGIMADAVLERCPQWLVFVGGASSFTDAQRFRVDEDYGLSNHWNGGNLQNATLNPLNVSTKNKIVLAPHAHAHGVYPQNYLYTPESNCTDDVEQFESLDLTSKQGETLCVDFINGTKTESKLGCSDSHVACSSYDHISIPDTLKNYETVMKEALGDLPDNSDTPFVLGAFSGVYGKTQPHQTAVLAYLIDFAASVQGGYFYALNPDTERYLEDSADGKAGTFAVTHYGLMQKTSWQEPNADLLEALQRIPSTEIPCYGGKETNSAATIARDSAFMLAGIAATTIFLV
ncbi:hypothetical protein PI124_g18112 [Phytophthora idaei]|nr:hypothetical protein PI124_g18112 [Phytophthora idaei]